MYLAIQNADPGKEIVAQGQTYFAAQTRRRELSDEEMEEQRRLTIWGELRQHNSSLAEAAKDAGVVEPRDYAIFQNHGYMGLYGGLSAQDIHCQKWLKKSQQILDHLGSTESWPPTSSAPLKPRINCAANKFTGKPKRTPPTAKSARKFA